MHPKRKRGNWQRKIKLIGVLLAVYALSFGPGFYLLYLSPLRSIAYIIYFPVLAIAGTFPDLGAILLWYADLWAGGETAPFLWMVLTVGIVIWLKRRSMGGRG